MPPVSVISGEVLLRRADVMAAIVVKRTALFFAIILAWTLLTAFARAETVSFSGYRRRHHRREDQRAPALLRDGFAAAPCGFRSASASPAGHGTAARISKASISRRPGRRLAVLWRRPGPAPVIPGGSPKNPMGVAALTFHNGELAIHGTNNPGSIGGYVSHGCIRMHNKRHPDTLFDGVGRHASQSSRDDLALLRAAVFRRARRGDFLCGCAQPSAAREVVGFSGYPRGTIVVKTSERRLYFVNSDGSAIRYPVGVGKAGMAWQGRAYRRAQAGAPVMGSAARYLARQSESAGAHSRRLAAQSDGRARARTRPRQLRDPRHQ